MGSDFLMNILVCEDDIYQREILTDMLLNHEYINCVETTTNGEELIQKVLADSDISALFINYKEANEGLNGLDAYMILLQRGYTLPAILVASHKPDAIRTYDLGILDIIEKPFTPYRMEKTLKKLHDHLFYLRFIQNGGLYVPIHYQELDTIMPNDILFFEAESTSRLIRVHTLQGIQETKIPLKAYERFLEHTGFFTSHRSFLVNVRRIHYIEGNKIYFRDTDRVAQVTDEKLFDIQNLWRKFCIL